MNSILERKVIIQKKLSEEAGSVSEYLKMMKNCANQIEKKFKTTLIRSIPDPNHEQSSKQ